MIIKYFDHAATTPVKQEVLKEMLPYFNIEFGNPSSIYSIGRKARLAIEKSRKKVGDSICAKSNEIYFTSCGSESDNLAIKGYAYANKNNGNHIITTKIEHPAILNTCKKLESQGFEVTYLGVNKYGIIEIEQLINSIKKNTILISVMSANNEIGTIQPLKEIGRISRLNNIAFHTDAVQAIGNIKLDVQELNIDLLSLSAHKFYGPKGIGCLYVRNGINFEKIQDGGHQENNKRAGTENVAEIVGLGKAIEIANKNIENYNYKLKNLRDYFIREITKNIPNILINGDMKNRLPGNINISFKDLDGEYLLFNLDEVGICASTGSACSSGSSEPSHVLVELGIPSDYINCSLRITFGEQNTKEEVIFLVENITKIINKYKNII